MGYGINSVGVGVGAYANRAQVGNDRSGSDSVRESAAGTDVAQRAAVTPPRPADVYLSLAAQGVVPVDASSRDYQRRHGKKYGEKDPQGDDYGQRKRNDGLIKNVFEEGPMGGGPMSAGAAVRALFG